MLLRLGSRAFDVRTRALVTGVVDAAPRDLLARAGRLVAEGADVVVVEGGTDLVEAVVALAAALDAPVGVATGDAGVAAAALAAGATLAEDRTGCAGAAWLAAARRAAAAVTLACGPPAAGAAAETLLDARWTAARAAGIDPERVALDPGGLVRPAPHATRPLVLDLDRGAEPPLAAASAGVALGYRLLRTTHVRTARRVADTAAAVLEAE